MKIIIIIKVINKSKFTKKYLLFFYVSLGSEFLFIIRNNKYILN